MCNGNQCSIVLLVSMSLGIAPLFGGLFCNSYRNYKCITFEVTISFLRICRLEINHKLSRNKLSKKGFYFEIMNHHILDPDYLFQ